MDLGEFVDASASLGNLLDIVTLDPDFFLLGALVSALAAFWHLDEVLFTVTHEVSELEEFTLVTDEVLDWEVSVNEAHLVTVAVGNTDEHVLEVAEHGADTGGELAVAEPAASDDLVLVSDVFEVEVEIAEIADEGTTAAGDGDDAGLDFDGDTFWDVKVFLVENWTWHLA